MSRKVDQLSYLTSGQNETDLLIIQTYSNVVAVKSAWVSYIQVRFKLL